MHIATPAVLALALLLGAPTARAQDISIQAALEKYNMLGTFAMNCAKPAAKDNYYLVRRPLDAGRIQSDVMIGPTERDRASVIDRATGLSPNEIAVSAVSEQQGRINFVYRVESNRWRTLGATLENGEKLVVDGYSVKPRAPIPWFNKCDAAATRATFEKYNLLGTFAVDCRKPASMNNYYIVHRPLDSGGIQSDLMIGPKERLKESVIDRAAELGPSEIAVSVSAESSDYLYRVEANRFRIVGATLQFGEKFIVDGVGIRSGAPVPWLNKCK